MATGDLCSQRASLIQHTLGGIKRADPVHSDDARHRSRFEDPSFEGSERSCILIAVTYFFQLLDFVVQGLSHVPFEALHAMRSVFHAPILHMEQVSPRSSSKSPVSVGNLSSAISLGAFLNSPKVVSKRVPSSYHSTV